MSMEGLKRKRSPNWHANEKNLLLSIVEENLQVLENKRTNGVNMRQKNAGWEKAEIVYNSKTSMAHRSAVNLRSEWDFLKKAAKKYVASRRMDANKTGGGPYVKQYDAFYERILAVIQQAGVGCESTHDADAHMIQPIPVPHCSTVNFEAVMVEEDNNCFPEQLEDELQSTPPKGSETQEVVDWSSYTPQQLQMPISSSLLVEDVVVEVSEGEERRTPTPHKTSNFASRRRPTLPKTSLQKLHENKTEALKQQMQSAREERAAAAEGEKIERGIKRERWRQEKIEREIKKERLRQEKIKSQILLLELKSKRKNV